MRVLVVEDDVKLARALAGGLAQEGYTVDLAATGDEALALAHLHDYESVLLDVMLPGIDGYEVCRQLRRRDRWLPVLMLTARADVADRIQGLDAGADDYLVKPFDFGELLARGRALIRRGPARPRARAHPSRPGRAPRCGRGRGPARRPSGPVGDLRRRARRALPARVRG